MAAHSPTPWCIADGTASMLTPWTVEGPFPGQRATKKRDGFAAYANIVNRIGAYVAQGLPPEVAAGIVEAVNERARLRAERTAAITYAVENDLYAVEAQREANQRADRLADIVRRMVPSLRLEIATCGGPKQAPALVKLLGEAREALGEVAP